MTKVTIVGAAGRMGQAMVKCSLDMEDLQITGAVEASDHADMGKDVGAVAGVGDLGVSITDDLKAALTDSDVMIDFTFHTVVPEHVKVAGAAGRAVVIGTTGLTDDEAMIVDRVADKVPVVWAPNMSLGVNLLFAVVKKAATILGDYKVDVDETHHIHKKDAPSGTALMLGEKVADGLKQDFRKIMIHDEDGSVGEVPDGKILITSHREGEVVGEHTVGFESEGERVEFTHHAKSRDCLAVGSLKAAQWVVTQHPRLYDMQDVLGL